MENYLTVMEWILFGNKEKTPLAGSTKGKAQSIEVLSMTLPVFSLA
ncbi:hypothetical protein [Segetibacter koreensis]|nr:hypothetical protein [Segetibacter koreensis]